MKNIVKLVVALMFGLVVVGCSETPTLYNSNDYKGESIRITDGFYLKKVYIQGIMVLLECDKEGNIIHNQPVGMGYQKGKVFENVAVITTNATNATDGNDSKYNFKCSDINDCYNQVVIVKNSLKN